MYLGMSPMQPTTLRFGASADSHPFNVNNKGNKAEQAKADEKTSKEKDKRVIEKLGKGDVLGAINEL